MRINFFIHQSVSFFLIYVLHRNDNIRVVFVQREYYFKYEKWYLEHLKKITLVVIYV